MTDLKDLLDRLDDNVESALNAVPVIDEETRPSVDDIPGQGANKWLKIAEVVAVVCDLKGSTQLGTGKHDSSTARIYKGAVEGAVNALHEFDADFIDIQGDGGFGLYWGDLAFERALCAGVTIRTFSAKLVERLVAKWPADKFPETGYKVGIASGRVLVKQIGTPRNPEEQEAVWAGKPVNFATKCAQSSDRHQVVVTGSVWDHFKTNDFVAYSCGCAGSPAATLWHDFTIERLPEDEPERYGRVVRVPWCVNCGPKFCDAIRTGETARDDIPTSERHALARTQMETALAAKAQKERLDRVVRRGLPRGWR